MIKKFNHENIIGYLDHGVTKISDNFGYLKQVNYLVMEYCCKGDLFDFVASTGSFSESLARAYIL